MKFLLIVSFFVGLVSVKSDGPTIKTDSGLIKGIKQFPAGIEINSFLGIPFALPPVGVRRYKKTVKLQKPFDGVLQADKFGPVCLQNSTEALNYVPGYPMSEDCLTLNIWTPKDAPGPTLYPVFLVLYGSDFSISSASEPDMRSDYLAAFTNTITVNMDYRLGALGFAYDGTPQFVGNQAIYDFLAAADWVRANIRHFGGDPERITVGGFSAGAIMLSGIFLTPTVSTSWFNRMVFFSGSAAEHVTVKSTKEIFKVTKQTAHELNCSEYSTSNDTFSIDEIVCLKTAPAKAIADSPSNGDYYLTYGDKYILPKGPTALLNSREFPARYTILIGTEQDEAVKKRKLIYKPKTVTQAISLLTETLYQLGLASSKNGSKIAEKYFEGVQEFDLPKIRQQIDAYLSDLEFHCPSLLSSVIYSLNGANTVYTYRNSYLTTEARSKDRPFGTYHGDGHDLFFGYPYRVPERNSDKDRETSLFMMKVLGDFIKGKDPFWSPIKVNGTRPDQISIPRWHIKNDAPIMHIDQDDEKSICLNWAEYFDYNIAPKSTKTNSIKLFG